jgi:hypothetical protein
MSCRSNLTLGCDANCHFQASRGTSAESAAFLVHAFDAALILFNYSARSTAPPPGDLVSAFARASQSASGASILIAASLMIPSDPIGRFVGALPSPPSAPS